MAGRTQRMNSYRITEGAEADLRDLWNWIAADNRKAADQLIADIRLGCEQVARHPASGSRRPRWTSDPVRFLIVCGDYCLVYMPETSPVEIVRVFHTSRDIPAILFAGD